MKINGIPHRAIWTRKDDPKIVQIIDQRHLPHQFVIEDLTHSTELVRAIKDMHVRGAPLIGVTAAYGVYLALLESKNSLDFKDHFKILIGQLRASRPTAINLEWAVEKQLKIINSVSLVDEKINLALKTAERMADEDVETCRHIGAHGLELIERIQTEKKDGIVNILTHCNAGWLACVDWGTATAPIYAAHEKGIRVHVWVSETRPRNQGASLTAWELLEQGVPHTVIADNAAGHLMQHGLVDLVLVGTDRTTSYGDVTNKIGTYLKALAAQDNRIPFYAAVPSSSIDWNIKDALKEIPIEERSPDEVKYIEGLSAGTIKKILIMPEKSAARNYAFDVTPARYVTGLITERGICRANRDSILALFSDGVIKFNCDWIKSAPLSSNQLKPLNDARNRFYEFGWIGEYENGIGFGNVSVRLNSKHEFLISGTQTGGIPKLTEFHYTQVVGFNLKTNSVACRGPVQASSESLTHAMLYQLSPETGAVLHIHNHPLWKELLGRVPTTRAEVPYGTPEMAGEVKRLFDHEQLGTKKIFAMAGHEDGVVTFGRDLAEAETLLKSYFSGSVKSAVR